MSKPASRFTTIAVTARGLRLFKHLSAESGSPIYRIAEQLAADALAKLKIDFPKEERDG